MAASLVAAALVVVEEAVSVEEVEVTWNSGVPVGFDMRDNCEASGSVEGVREIVWKRVVKEDVEREAVFILKSTMLDWGTLSK